MPLQRQRDLTLWRLGDKKKTKNKIRTNKNFTAKTECLNLNAPSNNVKGHSGKTITTQVYFFLIIQQMERFLDETG